MPHASTDLASAVTPTRFALERDRTVLLVLDLQEGAGARMPQEAFRRASRHAGVLVETARSLGALVLSSELAPASLGPLVSEVRARLPDDAAPVERLAYSCGAVKELARRLYVSGRKQVVVAGLETHAAVFQTVRDLAAGGYVPFVARDACCARHPEDHAAGLELMRDCGATITTTEAIVYDLLGAFGTPESERIAPMLR